MNMQDFAKSFGGRIVFIDTETTGLVASKDEVLSLSVVDSAGNVLFDHLIKPRTRKRWPKAQEVNGIAPSDVKDEKTLEEYADELAPLFDGTYLVVGYNVSFDLGMLEASGLDVSKCKSFDVMREYEKVFGSRVKLVQCATSYGYGSFEAHGSLEDAKATAYCFSRLIADERYTKICDLESRGLSREDARVIANQQSSSGCILPLAIAVFILIVVVIILAVL